MESLEERRVPSRYSIINMGSLNGGTAGTIGGIDNHGEVAGASYTPSTGPELAYLFSHGSMKSLTLGGPTSQAFGINDNGEVVGLSTIAAGDNQAYLFLYHKGHITNMGPIDFSKPFGTLRINNHGDMTGLPLSDGDASLLHDGKLADLGSLAGLGSAALGLNNHDQVAGYSEISQSNSTAIIHAFIFENGKMIDLGAFGGSSSQGNGINDHGEVVGTFSTAGGAIHGFLFNHGRMTDLGSLGGGATEAFAINDSGDIVGDSTDASNRPNGFLYEHGKMVNLNSLIPAGSKFSTFAAEAINNRGQIAALASSTNPLDHSEYLVLLTPRSNAH